MIGEKVLVNRTNMQTSKSPLIIPDSASKKKGEILTGVILSKGKGSPLNNLKDLHEGDIVAYPPSAPIPVSAELLKRLNIESTNVEIIEAKDIIGTI